ncbi:hypothetical protein [Deinococcus yavapaiensis]|uniref:Uncharacterized protein n=1 Tax=Deinococcus yavapaiensis KR-236 TaxID=694435 RepID=A0A318S093_9DEIO|nr:hypothetical protein [Deinococcus yavapaiensis]PYE50415.1 hypothetical protein DES52_11832 [Deinococcus yavapaiensis KR-236]
MNIHVPIVRFALLAALTLHPGAFASRCAELRPFLSSALDAPLIVQARVVRHAQTLVPPSFAEVRVLATLKGRAPSTTLRILDSDGALAVQNASAYPVGTTWVFALRPSVDGASFTLPVCGDGALAVIGKNVFGNLEGGLASVLSLTDLRDRLRGSP